MSTMRKKFHRLVQSYQTTLIQFFESIDGSSFIRDPWTRDEGGGGLTAVIENGEVIEKGGVNTSEVYGPLTDDMIKVLNLKHIPEERTFHASGISSVIHPRNPMVPTTHFNWRYFELGNGEDDGSWWFGGGADLTPYYIFEGDCKHFHTTQKKACDTICPSLYPTFKKDADTYFYLPFRKEARGVGGTFYMKKDDFSKNELYDLAKHGLDGVMTGYGDIIQRRKDMSYTEKNRQWQLMRRGRYVEFNLVCDVGTKFGLATNGRTESILMSLPNKVEWAYNSNVEPHSKEAKLLDILKTPRDWA